MSTITCPNCRAQVPAGAAFCDNCGTRLAAAPRPAVAVGGLTTCPRCGHAVQPDDTFCGNCGSPLLAPEPVAASGVCPNCHAAVRPDDRFCDNCGYALFAAANPQPNARPAETLVVSAAVANASGYWRRVRHLHGCSSMARPSAATE